MANRFGAGSPRDVDFAAPFENRLQVSGSHPAPQPGAIVAPLTDGGVADGFGRDDAVTKSYTALAIGGAGAAAAPPVTAPLLLTDAQPGDTSTTATLTVGGASVIATIDTIGDRDFFRIELVQGQSYEIGMYMKTGGPTGVPLADAYLELYDSSGHLLVSADGGGPNTASGLDALLTYTADHTGTYYINARAFDNVAQDGPNGDLVGDYELFARPADPNGYHPHYTPDSPLYSIDWGTQVDDTTRNPDGDNGPRDNGAALSTPPANEFGITGKNVITYYLAKPGDVFIDEDPTTPGTTETMVAKGWSGWEINALNLAFDAYEKVADIDYVEVDNREAADFVFVTYNGTPGPGVSLLGRMSPPNEENEGQAEFNALDERWTQAGLAPGGFTFTTLIHEMGHGHGLAHPHDNGGHSGIMNGVEDDGVAFSYTNGDFDLNQSVYTMMSYEDGWEKSPYGQAETTDPFGWLGSLMAFDVAAIQDKYGVNEDYAKGDNTYALKDVNAPGTFYECLWDAGGVDNIVYVGDRDANIDLRAATLKYEYGGGGWISYADGVFGGFTIANGVTIENAAGGNGDDHLTGNDIGNILTGGGGDDFVLGNAGEDFLYGDAGDDSIEGGIGNDQLFGGAGIDQMTGGAGKDYFTGGAGADIMTGGAGMDLYIFHALSDSSNAAPDRIIDATGDRIDLRKIDANTTVARDQAFTFVSAFTHLAGEATLTWDQQSNVTTLLLDVNGDALADFTLLINGDMTQAPASTWLL